MQVRDDGGLRWTWYKRSDSGYTFMRESTGFPDGLDVGFEKNREIKDDANVSTR